MTELHTILRRFPTLHDPSGRPLGLAATALSVTPLAGGLINDTFALGDTHILQRLHPIFRQEVNLDIRALTAPLRAAGVPVPRIEEADDGQPWVAIAGREGPALAGVWRVITRLPGRTLHRLEGPAQAASAARLIARFHRALLPVQHAFAFTRPGAHDTDAHMALLQRALREHAAHPLAPQVAPLARELLARWAGFQPPAGLPVRIIHGDLKVSNLLFDPQGEACGIIDLDTMAHGGLDVELGDALRSWCNRAQEHDAQARLDTDILAAAVRAYCEEAADWLQPHEAAALVSGMMRITLELTARFAADALRECYFGWSPAVAPTRGEHNLLRARNQLDLAGQLAAFTN